MPSRGTDRPSHVAETVVALLSALSAWYLLDRAIVPFLQTVVREALLP